MRAFTILFALVMALGCGPNPPAPVRVMAVVPTESGTYEAREVQLQTIGNMTTLKGSVAELVGAGRIMLDPSDPTQTNLESLSDAQRFDVVVKDKGTDVRGNYLTRDGVLWPADFHTWNMVSTYWNFENAFLYFQDLLAAQQPMQTPDELSKMRVFYWADVRLTGTDAETDNAFYMSYIKSFAIVPTVKLQQIPMAMNLGTIGHEVAHRVFVKRVFNDEGIPTALRSWSGEAFNLLKSLDEGLADFHGYGVSCRAASGCRSDFLAASVPDQALTKLRDISRNDACLSAELRTELKTLPPDAWLRTPDRYTYGDLWASALYQAGSKAGGLPKVKALQVALIAAYSDETSDKPGLNQLINRNLNNQMAFTQEAVASVIASHIGDIELRRAFCSEAMDRLQLQCDRPDCTDKMPSCPGSTRRGTTCKVLP